MSDFFNLVRIGPKTNTVEMLSKLRDAGKLTASAG